MTSGYKPALFLLLGLAVAGCAEEGPPSTSETTAQLLAQPITDGNSTQVIGNPDLPQDLPPISVTELGFNRGDTAAIVKVVEMSDFGCGFCRRFHEESFPVLLDEFIDTGMIEWKFIPYVTGMFANSLAATEASECVMEQDDAAYLRMAGRLWDEQSVWKNSDDPEPVLRGWVSELGVDMEAFDGCLSEDRRVNRIAQATTLARQMGVRGTPTFVVVGYGPLQGALPTDFFQELFTAVHAEEARVRAEAGEETGN